MEEGVSYERLDLDGDDRMQTLRRDLGVSAFGLNLLRLRPGQRSRIHRHERQEEVYLVLEGVLTLSVEGRERDLGRGELARVGPDVRRQLVNRANALCAVLAIGGAAEHASRDGVAYTSWEATEGRSPQETPFPDDLPAAELRTGP
jgi:uncharacterized cupin superfamily protein